jgi:hypothetical protein
METKYDEIDSVYYITEDENELLDPDGFTMIWDSLDEAEKYRTNLEMIRLIYGDQ